MISTLIEYLYGNFWNGFDLFFLGRGLSYSSYMRVFLSVLFLTNEVALYLF